MKEIFKRVKSVAGARGTRFLAGLAFLALLTWGGAEGVLRVAARGRIFPRTQLALIPAHRTAVVLGCCRTLRNGRLNLYFRHRIAAAAELYRAGKVDAILVSGDNHVKGYDEPSDMKAALEACGVPSERIVCDFAGFRTLDTVVRAKKVFGVESCILVSQPEHLRRAVFLARAFGCAAVGYAADEVHGRHALRTRIREQFSKIAAVFDAVVRRQPKFLGPPEALPPVKRTGVGSSADARHLKPNT